MIQLIYSSSKGIFRSTTICFQTVHFLEVQVKKWIVLEEKEKHDFVCSQEKNQISQILSDFLYMLLYYKELVPNIFLKSTHELSQSYLTYFKHIASKTIIKIIYEASVTFQLYKQTMSQNVQLSINSCQGSEFEKMDRNEKRINSLIDFWRGENVSPFLYQEMGSFCYFKSRRVKYRMANQLVAYDRSPTC